MSGIRTEIRRRTRERDPASMRLRRAEVCRNVQLAPRFCRLTVGGDDLVGFVGGELPADAVKAFLPAPGQRTPVLPELTDQGRLAYPPGEAPPDIRAYTVRRFDPDALELDLDVVLHGDSVSTRWARAAQPGDEIAVAGPRHDFYASPDVDWYLLVADETALPAVAAIVETLPDGTRAHVTVEVGDADDHLPLRVRPGVRVEWLYRDGRAPGTTDLLERAVADLDWPEGAVQAWVAAEAGAVRAVRRCLTERGVPAEHRHLSGYWRNGMTNAELDEVTMRRYERAVDSGTDVNDLEPEDDTAA